MMDVGNDMIAVSIILNNKPTFHKFQIPDIH